MNSSCLKQKGWHLSTQILHCQWAPFIKSFLPGKPKIEQPTSINRNAPMRYPTWGRSPFKSPNGNLFGMIYPLTCVILVAVHLRHPELQLLASLGKFIQSPPTPPKKTHLNNLLCVDCNISLIWNKAISGWFPLLTMIPVRSRREVVIIYPNYWTNWFSSAPTKPSFIRFIII